MGLIDLYHTSRGTELLVCRYVDKIRTSMPHDCTRFVLPHLFVHIIGRLIVGGSRLVYVCKSVEFREYVFIKICWQKVHLEFWMWRLSEQGTLKY